jgi:cell division initiation protein
MEPTARDIHEKQFHDAWRGYNQEEVDDFLDRVAESFDITARENVALQGRVHELEQALTTSRETEEMLKKTLVSAQQAAEEAIAKAKEKANALVAEAEERSARMNEEVDQRLTSIDAEIRRKVLEADREHTVRSRELDSHIERLRAFETELKQRLQTFLEQQTRSLEMLADHDAPAERVPPRPDAGNGATSATEGARAETPSKGARSQDLQTETPEPSEGTVRLPQEADAAPHRRSVRSFFGRDE